MKKQLTLLIAIFFIQNASYAQTTYTWTGGTSSFTTSTNWSPNGTPGPSDDVVFDGTSGANCNFDADISVNNIIITSAYTGTVNALATLPTINSNFSQAGGTFISTSGNMDVLGNISFTGGTFTHNSGDITVTVGIGSTWLIAGAMTFNNLNISFSAGNPGTERIISFGGCSANNLFLDGSTRLYSYQGSISILGSLTVLGSNTGIPTANTGTFTFSGAGPISISGASTASRNKLPSLVFNTSGTISMSNHINLQGNWTGTQGTLTVGSSTQNFYGSSAAISGTAAAFDNLNIQSGAVVSMPSNAEVKIGGSLTRTGTLNFQTTTALGLNAPGVTGQTISGTGFTLAGIKAYGSGSARNVTISTPISILDSIKVGANVTFASGGNITLKSTNALTARVARIDGGGSVTGSVTVETFIPGGTTGWANLGVRGVTGQTIANWDSYVSSSGANGLPMTCVGCAYSPTIIGTGSNSFVSVQGWSESADDYFELTSTDLLDPGTGIWAYAGDGQATTGGLTLINTGILAQGNINVTLGNSGPNGAHYNLVSNPYACPISWTEVIGDAFNALNVNDVIYVYNADLSVTTSYVSASNTSSHGTGGITDVIPGGQAFYVEALSAGLGSLAFSEPMKSFSVTGNTSANPVLKTTGTNNIQVFRLKVAGASDWDETAFVTHSAATKGFDRNLDAHKFFQSPGYAGYPGAYTKYTSISSKDVSNEDYSINTIPPLTSSVTIPVLVRVSTSGTYTITAKDFQNFTTCVGLIDKLTNSYHDLRSNPYVCAINDTTSAPRFELVLCRDQSLNLVSVAELEQSHSIFIRQDQQSAYVKTEFAQNTKAVISAFNILGQKLMEDVLVEGKTTTTRLNLDLHNQVVIIQVRTDKESSTNKIVLH